jgi:hypothetical protein
MSGALSFLDLDQSVFAPPTRGDARLLPRIVGELDLQRLRSSASTAAADVPVPGTCVRIDSARKP